MNAENKMPDPNAKRWGHKTTTPNDFIQHTRASVWIVMPTTSKATFVAAFAWVETAKEFAAEANKILRPVGMEYTVSEHFGNFDPQP